MSGDPDEFDHEGEDEDEGVPLPPIDDGGDDEAHAEGDFGEDEPMPDSGSRGDAYDDAVADDLDAGPDGVDEEGDEDAGGDDEIDVGAIDEGIDLDETSALGDEQGFAVDVDDAIDEGPSGVDDGGVEGTDDLPEDAVDEALLPALDADDEGTDDEVALAEELLGRGDGGDDAGRAPIAALRVYAAESGVGADVPCACVAVFGDVVVAAGEALLLGRGGDRAKRVGADEAGLISDVALAEDVLACATARGAVLVSGDGGVTLVPLRGFRAGPTAAISVVATPGRAWIHAGSKLWSYRVEDERLTEVVAEGVRAVAQSGGVVTALVDLGAGAALQLLRGDDERWPPVPLSCGAFGTQKPVRLAVSERHVAITQGRWVSMSTDGGATFVDVTLEVDDRGEWEARKTPSPAELARGQREEARHGHDVRRPAGVTIAAIAFGRDGGLLVALSPSMGEASSLLEIRGSRASLVATISHAAPSFTDPGAVTIGLAWDGSRDRIWVASQAGLQAFSRASRH